MFCFWYCICEDCVEIVFVDSAAIYTYIYAHIIYRICK